MTQESCPFILELLCTLAWVVSGWWPFCTASINRGQTSLALIRLDHLEECISEKASETCAVKRIVQRSRQNTTPAERRLKTRTGLWLHCLLSCRKDNIAGCSSWQEGQDWSKLPRQSSTQWQACRQIPAPLLPVCSSGGCICCHTYHIGDNQVPGWPHNSILLPQDRASSSYCSSNWGPWTEEGQRYQGECRTFPLTE